jgi:hypothetical protein
VLICLYSLVVLHRPPRTPPAGDHPADPSEDDQAPDATALPPDVTASHHSDDAA